MLSNILIYLLAIIFLSCFALVALAPRREQVCENCGAPTKSTYCSFDCQAASSW